MDWIKQITNNKCLQTDLHSFCNHYGLAGLNEAMKLYANMQEKYTCKTKTSITKILIDDIYYLEIEKHDISVHTKHGVYHKYGTLTKELEFLSSYGFVKCNQSCLVSTNKIKQTIYDDIILIDGSKIHMSRNCAPKILFELCKSKH